MPRSTNCEAHPLGVGSCWGSACLGRRGADASRDGLCQGVGSFACGLPVNLSAVSACVPGCMRARGVCDLNEADGEVLKESRCSGGGGSFCLPDTTRLKIFLKRLGGAVVVLPLPPPSRVVSVLV